MIGLCQEGKSSPDALGRSAGVNSFLFFAACVGFSAVVPLRENQTYRAPTSKSSAVAMHCIPTVSRIGLKIMRGFPLFRCACLLVLVGSVQCATSAQCPNKGTVVVDDVSNTQ